MHSLGRPEPAGTPFLGEASLPRSRADGGEQRLVAEDSWLRRTRAGKAAAGAAQRIAQPRLPPHPLSVARRVARSHTHTQQQQQQPMAPTRRLLPRRRLRGTLRGRSRGTRAPTVGRACPHPRGSNTPGAEGRYRAAQAREATPATPVTGAPWRRRTPRVPPLPLRAILGAEARRPHARQHRRQDMAATPARAPSSAWGAHVSAESRGAASLRRGGRRRRVADPPTVPRGPLRGAHDRKQDPLWCAHRRRRCCPTPLRHSECDRWQRSWAPMTSPSPRPSPP